MDPKTNIEEQRALAQRIIGPSGERVKLRAAERLAKLVLVTPTVEPSKNIERQRELALSVLSMADTEDEPIEEETAIALAENVLALDEWRQKGGFDPYSVPTALADLRAVLDYAQPDEEKDHEQHPDREHIVHAMRRLRGLL